MVSETLQHDPLHTDSIVVCPECNETFKNWRAAKIHIGMKHKAVASTLKEGDEKFIKRRPKRVLLEDEAALHPACPECHSEMREDVFNSLIPTWFQVLTGLPKGLIGERFMRQVREVNKRHYNKLRKSALRTILERGDITIPSHHSVRLDKLCNVLDLFETMVYDRAMRDRDE